MGFKVCSSFIINYNEEILLASAFFPFLLDLLLLLAYLVSLGFGFDIVGLALAEVGDEGPEFSSTNSSYENCCTNLDLLTLVLTSGLPVFSSSNS